MLARSFRSRGLAALGTLAIAACASTASDARQRHVAHARVPPLTPTSRVLDAERIEGTAAQTAWDAIRLLVPNFRLQSGRVTSLRTYSPLDASHFESSVRLIIDGHRVRDFDALRSISARDVVAIHVLSALDAATYLDPWSGGGAIIVQTRNSLRRR